MAPLSDRKAMHPYLPSHGLSDLVLFSGSFQWQVTPHQASNSHADAVARPADTSNLTSINTCAASDPDCVGDGPAWILATSATTSSFSASRVLLSDRKSFLGHLHPKALVISTVRLATISASTIFATFVTDQLALETKNEELVRSGVITGRQCDDLNKQWEDEQWAECWGQWRYKASTTIARFHATTILMRLYELTAERVFGVSDVVLDLLTTDTFRAARQKAERNGGSTEGRARTRREMFTAGLWANAIAFLADATVQQVILSYGYWVYYQSRKAEKKMKSGDKEKGALIPPSDAGAGAASKEVQDTGWASDAEDEENDGAAVAMSFLVKSVRIVVSRSLSLVAASIGGAYGTLLRPGWGTLLGTSLGDSLAASLLEA